MKSSFKQANNLIICLLIASMVCNGKSHWVSLSLTVKFSFPFTIHRFLFFLPFRKRRQRTKDRFNGFSFHTSRRKSGGSVRSCLVVIHTVTSHPGEQVTAEQAAASELCFLKSLWNNHRADKATAALTKRLRVKTETKWTKSGYIFWPEVSSFILAFILEECNPMSDQCEAENNSSTCPSNP